MDIKLANIENAQDILNLSRERTLENGKNKGF